MKADLVMWTKNGALTLPSVLDRINKVVPAEVVNQRFIVDDGSTDNTRMIAYAYGWDVRFNKGRGISDGANTALKNVETDYFCSFEQDVLLAYDWWSKVSPLISLPKVAAASGMRFYPNNNVASKIELHTYLSETKKSHSSVLSLFSKSLSEKTLQLGFGRTLDNTIYSTALVRDVGGFPKLTVAGIDTVFAWVLKTQGYDWLVHTKVKSKHLRSSCIDALKHQYMYATSFKEIDLAAERLTHKAFPEQASIKTFVKRLIRSPAIGLYLGTKYSDLRLAFYYPVFYVCHFNGYLKGKQFARNLKDRDG